MTPSSAYPLRCRRFNHKTVRVRLEGPDMDVLDASSAEQAILPAPLRAVGFLPHHSDCAEALELSVRVRVGPDVAVEIKPTRLQARFLPCV